MTGMRSKVGCNLFFPFKNKQVIGPVLLKNFFPFHISSKDSFY